MGSYRGDSCPLISYLYPYVPWSSTAMALANQYMQFLWFLWYDFNWRCYFSAGESIKKLQYIDVSQASSLRGGLKGFLAKWNSHTWNLYWFGFYDSIHIPLCSCLHDRLIWYMLRQWSYRFEHNISVRNLKDARHQIHTTAKNVFIKTIEAGRENSDIYLSAYLNTWIAFCATCHHINSTIKHGEMKYRGLENDGCLPIPCHL